MINSPSHAIELLGGAKIVALGLKRPLTTVASWATRESIPVECWPKLIDLAREQKRGGFTFEALARAHADQASKSDKPTATKEPPARASRRARGPGFREGEAQTRRRAVKSIAW